ncbi:unnamed protein product [Ectocarpus sp. CCAP 1310/34]|nr:unnamed protein product [Ectocarpus sp. CCAP 1310/34]
MENDGGQRTHEKAGPVQFPGVNGNTSPPARAAPLARVSVNTQQPRPRTSSSDYRCPAV